MKRFPDILALACMAAALILTAGCGKQGEQPAGKTAQTEPKIDPAEAAKILAENTPLLTDADAEKRLSAVAAIGDLRGQGAKAAGELINMLGNPREEKRIKDAVKDALKKIGSETVPLMVDKMFENFDALASYRNQIDAVREREKDDAAKSSRKDQEIVALQAEQDRLQTAKTALETSLAEKEAALKAAAEKLAAVETGQEGAMKELADAKSKNADLQTEIGELKSKMLLLQTEADMARDELAAARAAATAGDDTIATLQREITQLKQAIAALEAKIKELQG